MGTMAEAIIGCVMVRLDALDLDARLTRERDRQCRPASRLRACGPGGVTEGRRPGRPCAATLSVASTTLRCEVVAYIPERRFLRKADIVRPRSREASATSRPPPGQTDDTCSGA